MSRRFVFAALIFAATFANGIGENTTFTVMNTSQFPQIARVTI